MSEEQKQQESKPRPNKYTGVIKNIQNNALNFDLSNGTNAELTYQQALSIHLRSVQLTKEGNLHSSRLSKKAKEYQIEQCYRQQKRRTMDQ